ncbi:MAG: RNA polymerase factor sigma-54, partial [Alphaproteobacteria bacterium]|nr:RNA polymerase factor sigma-54 [Alphaproteobacteria bacterium]
MAIGPRLELRQGQTLVMTPQLRQAIQLLQYSNQELASFVDQELERNPFLERDETPVAPEADAELPNAGLAFFRGRGGSHGFAEDTRGIDDIAAEPRSLRDHLGEQLRLSFDDPADRLIGAHLIALLDPAGRLTAQPAALAAALGTEIARVEAVRAKMQRFDPVGLFCRDLAECLAVQLAERNRLDPAMQALLQNLDLLARRDLRRLMRLCGVDAEDLNDMIAEIRALDPKPGSRFDPVAAQPLVPDVLMRRAPDGDWVLELNPDTMPRVLVNRAFHPRVALRGRSEERSFLAERLQSANWLVKSLQQRAETILKVAAEIVAQQDGFFRHGVGHLRPLTLRDVADAVSLHESTISRVTANKSIATPRGVFELKYFFTAALSGTSGESHSAEAVRHRIRALINAEPAGAVLSDEAIAAALRAESVAISRRTVAKYREALRIPGSAQRRREK